MVLLRRLLGDALRRARQRQQRTLREVSSAARVSLGYLSEVERGQKEASSELLSAICDALDVRLSDVLREVSAAMDAELTPVGAGRDRVVVEPVVIDRSDLPVASRPADLPPLEPVSAALGAGLAGAAMPVGFVGGQPAPGLSAQCLTPVTVAA